MLKKRIRKSGGLILVLSLLLSMIMSVTVFAEGGEEVCVQVSGIPEQAVQIGDTVKINVEIQGDISQWSSITYSLTGPFGDPGFVEGKVVNGQAAISAEVQDVSGYSAECLLYVSGENGNGESKTLLNQEFTLSIVQPKLTIISGVPQGSVLAGSEAEIKVTATGLNQNADYYYYVEAWGLTADNNAAKADITRGVKEATVTLKGTVSDYADDEATIEVFLYKCRVDGADEIEGGELVAEAQSSSFEIKDRVKFSLNWKTTDKVTAGTPYPFSVTIANVSGEDMKEIMLQTYTPRHTSSERWAAAITYQPQEMITTDGGIATIKELKAGETITIEGTVVYPANAVGDTTHLAAYVYEMRGEEAYIIANTDTRDHPHHIVAAGSGQEQGASGQNGNSQSGKEQSGDGGQAASNAKTGGQNQAARTGDTAPIAGTLAVLILSALAAFIAAGKKARG